MRKTELLQKINTLSTAKMTDESMAELSGYLKELGTLENQDHELSELLDLFPAYQLYKNERTLMNFQKLCIEIVEFCKQLYASTTTDEQRAYYKRIMASLIE